MIDVEITVSEGGHWLKLQVSEEVFLEWINTKYTEPYLEGMVRMYALKFQFGDRVMIRDFVTNSWSFDQ